MLAAMTRRTFIFLALLLLSLGFTASELGTRARRLRAAGKRERVPAEAAGHGEEAHGRRRASARRGSRARHPAQRRQRGRCRHRRADGAQPGRAAILGLGGGGYILYWDAGSKQLASIDGRETAPAGATPELFLDTDGKPLPRDAAMASGLSIGVPGALAALALAHDKYGKLPWAELFEPAIALAREGFPISPRLAQMLAEADPLSFAPAARAYFFDAQGRPWPVGYKLANPALADTFETIARDGAKAFYQGDIAKDIASAVQNDPRKPGKLAAEDIASYRAIEREPICAPYRAHKVCGMGPSSSGGVTVAQVLGIVEPFNLGPAPAGRARHACHRRSGAARFRRPRALPRRYGFRSRPARRAARPDLPCRTPRLDQSGTRPRQRCRRIAAEREARRFRQ